MKDRNAVIKQLISARNKIWKLKKRERIYKFIQVFDYLNKILIIIKQEDADCIYLMHKILQNFYLFFNVFKEFMFFYLILS